MNQDKPLTPPRIRLFPKARLENDYPWSIWLIGWFVLLKSFLWTATDPLAAEPVLRIMGYKYLIAMIPFAILVVGLWNLRKWAFVGLIVACVADLAFFGLFPAAIRTMPIQRTDTFSTLASAAVFLVNSPIGNLIVLAFMPVMKKHIGDYRLLREDSGNRGDSPDSQNTIKPENLNPSK